MRSVHVVYVSQRGQTARIAGRIGALLEDRGLEVVESPLDALPVLPSGDGVVLGASIHLGEHPREAADWVRRNLPALRARPSAFFSVSMSAALAEVGYQRQARGWRDAFLWGLGWRPLLRASFGGALDFASYSLVERLAVGRFAQRLSVDPRHRIDRVRNWEFTRWDDVDSFACSFATLGGLAICA